jgi:hypothetical protein
MPGVESNRCNDDELFPRWVQAEHRRPNGASDVSEVGEEKHCCR